MNPATRTQGHRTVALIVEDDPDTREMYAVYLTGLGISVVEARNGAQALEKATTFLPDVITADLDLPVMGGLELCRHLKAQDRTKAIPVIAVTARAVAPEIREAIAAGCDAVLIKPCTPDVLLAEICRLLQIPSPDDTPTDN